jgi:myo-inositol-1(or 4)-monophosphatase
MRGPSRYQSEREAAVLAARKAGSLLQEWSGRISVRVKGINDLVTEADHASQEAIREYLGRRFPRDGFLGEEGCGTRDPNVERSWVVDPLDGTTNYVHGFPFFCVSIGLEVGGRLVVGVIYDPVRQECFAASECGGATCNDLPMQVSPTGALHDALLCGGVPADPGMHRTALAEFVNLSKRARSVRRMGSAALSLAYVAAGRLDGFWHTSLHPWDAAAGAMIVAEAGGRVTNTRSNSYDLYLPVIVASNGLIHASLTDQVCESQCG